MAMKAFHSAVISRSSSASAPVDLLFPWWSFTKTAIAAAALRLAEDGLLQLDAPLPDRPYTLRQLLQHRAGVRDYAPLTAYHEAVARNETPWPRGHLLDAADAGRLLFPPGTGWSYSNIGYMFVGDAITEATGVPLAAALRALVLAPAGADAARLAAGPADFADIAWPSVRCYDPGWVYHGCLIGTPSDAAKLLHTLLRGALLQPPALAAMTECHPLGDAVPGRPWRRHGYGLGLMIGELDGAGAAIGHTGGGPGCVNAVYHFPDRAVTVAVFTDGDDPAAAETQAAVIATGSDLA